MITQEDILRSYHNFIKGKRKKTDVQDFILNSEEELLNLYQDIVNKEYHHGDYKYFKIDDTKPREIHKPSMRDRIVHQLVYDYLVDKFDKKFYFHSYAARKDKGSHKAVTHCHKIIRNLNSNRQNRTYILKCDIKKYFANVNKELLLSLIKNKIDDEYYYLVKKIVNSFKIGSKTGIPLGNLSSQIFANIYLSELDRYVKHNLKVKNYIRYMDDFVIIDCDLMKLNCLAKKIKIFLWQELKLILPDEKKVILKYSQGVDFLGYKIFPHHTILRTKTKKRILKKMEIKRDELNNGRITKNEFEHSQHSYSGILGHCCGRRLSSNIMKIEIKLD